MLESAAESQLDPPPARRLVIRVKLIRQEPPPPPAPRRWSRSALLLMLGAVAVPLCWLGISTFRSQTPAPQQAPVSAPLAPSAAPAEESSVAVDKPLPTPAAEPAQQPDAPTSTVHEEIPDVPRSALQTIRGTVRVSVRVIVDRKGTVVAAIADDRGPSRYFERLSVEASKSWVFTPVNSDEQRIMLLRFHFTRAGATAHASPVQ